MKKLKTLLLSALLAFTLGATSYAANTNPAAAYESSPTGDVGAWSYIKVTPVSGASSRTHYLFSNYQTTTLPIEGKVDTVAGFSYSRKTNTLTIRKVAEEDLMLLIHNMGTGFTLKLSGTNSLRSLKVDNENWNSGLTVFGTGKITLGNSDDHNHVPFEVNGTTELLGGTIKCIAEKTDVQSVGGLRYSFLVNDARKNPLHTALKFKGALDGNESANKTSLVRSTADITFSGKALKTLSVKRNGKTVSWNKVKGCKYQVKHGKKIIITKKTSYKTNSKMYVRALKITNGVMICSQWSKKI